jgi:hypothetical protein
MVSLRANGKAGKFPFLPVWISARPFVQKQHNLPLRIHNAQDWAGDFPIYINRGMD